MLYSSAKILFSSTRIHPPEIERISKNVEPQFWMSSIEEFSRRDLYGCYEIGAEDIRELELIFGLAQDHGIKLTVVASFIHPTLAEYFFRGDNGAAFMRFLSVVRQSAISHDVPAWFISPYSHMASGTPIHSYEDPLFLGLPDFYDPGHANMAAYRKILDAVFFNGAERADDLVITKLDSLSLEQVEARFRKSRNDYLRRAELKFWDRLDSLRLAPRSRCP
jgi:hypothetical protein